MEEVHIYPDYITVGEMADDDGVFNSLPAHDRIQISSRIVLGPVKRERAGFPMRQGISYQASE